MTRPLTLLFVDDDADIRTVVELALGLDPLITLRLASSAAEALALLADWTPDACLFDVMMPHVDGLGLLKAARQAGVEAPVIFMTARAREGDIARYVQAGAIGTIAKPFDPLALPGMVRRLLDD